ncbi:sigma factor [Nonomuraea sp. NPDC049607]|uniref:sigma factor n=1 Tax=Nonomuraea sp. NPDC049607 TaxID=3154732 RepID=UPI00343B7682
MRQRTRPPHEEVPACDYRMEASPNEKAEKMSRGTPAGEAREPDVTGYRPLLFSIAYGMTGSVGDAEDIVQDAFLGLTRARNVGTEVTEPKAYLTTAVTRLGIEVNCRQILTRARQRIATGRQARDGARPLARRAEGEELARRFFAAADGGDLDALLGLLAPDVVLHGDGGGKAQAMARPAAGASRVVKMLVAGLRRVRALGVSARIAWINGRPGAVMYDAEGRVAGVVELDVADGVVQAIHSVVNPDKLAHLGPVSDVARLPKK